jgi:hypothetical protein
MTNRYTEISALCIALAIFKLCVSMLSVTLLNDVLLNVVAPKNLVRS